MNAWALAAVGAMTVGAAPAWAAAPVQWTAAQGGNGHYYEFVLQPNVKWDEARAAAQGRTFAGVAGHLTTVTSAAENAFVGANTGQSGLAWLGGFQDFAAPDFAEPAGGFRWITGEPWAYTSWYTKDIIEPDNSGGHQHFVLTDGTLWDDFQNDPRDPSILYVYGYQVEYAVPEPAAGAAAAAAAVVAIRRRRRAR